MRHNELPMVPRWMQRSMRVHFDTYLALTASGFNVFYDGQNRDTNKYTEYFEFRIDGPRIGHIQKGFRTFTCEVNVLCTVQPTKSLDTMARMTGIATSAFTNAIEWKRYGKVAESVLNDGSSIGCALLQTDRGSAVKTNNFGVIGPKQNIEQSAVHGIYMLQVEITDDH